MGFGIDKETLVANLEEIRAQRCCYMGDVCDCKYRIDPKNKFSVIGETTGCPEIRQAIWMLTALTEEEFNELALKANITL